MPEKPKHLVIACGGTGGHFYPAVATAREYQRQGGPVTLAVAGHNTEQQLVEASRLGIAAMPAEAVRMPKNPLLLPAFLFKLRLLRNDSSKLLRELQADLVLGMGSFATVPLLLAATNLRLPVFIHEANALLGRANAYLSRRARALGYSLPLCSHSRRCRCRCRLVHTGMPLRQELIEAAAGSQAAAAQADARLQLGLQPDKPTLLIFGGSQGARFINGTVQATIPLLAAAGTKLQVIHLTGAADNPELTQAYAAAGILATVRQRESAMHLCYLAADLVLCRAGASTICELALFGRGAMLVPLPTAADNHQQANAESAAAIDGAAMILQEKLNPKLLFNEINSWIDSPAAWRNRGLNLQKLGKPEAAASLTKMILNEKTVTE